MADIVQLGLSLDASKVLQARDKATRALDRIEASSKRTQKSVAALQRGFGRLTGVIGGFVGAALLTRGFRAMIDATEQAEKSQAKLQSVVKATGESAGLTVRQLNRLSEQLDQTTLFNDDELRNTAAVLATFRNIQGEVFKEALGSITDMATVLDGDLKSAAILVGKALNDPVARMGELSEAGIILTDSQKDLIRTMTAAGDIAGAQGVILAELAVEFGGGAAGANVGLTGSIADATDSWNDFLQSLGQTGPTQAKLGGFFGFLDTFFQKRVLTTDPLEDLIIKQEELNELIDRRRRGGVTEQEDQEIKALKVQVSLVKEQIARITDLRLVDQRRAEAAAEALRAERETAREADMERRAQLKLVQEEAENFNANQKALAAAWNKSWGRAIENTQDSFADFFKGLLTREVDNFKDFADRIFDIWLNLIAQMAAAELFGQVLKTGFGQRFTSGGTPDLIPIPTELSNVPGGAPPIIVNQSFDFVVSAMDGASFAVFAEDNKRIIAGAAAAGVRDSAGLRRAFRG